MQPLHPKVKVPAVVGVIATILLALLAVVGTGVPAILPYTTLASTILLTITGYFTYADR